MTGSSKSCRGGRTRGSVLRFGALVALLAAPAPSSAQATVRVTVEENFRREPQGQVLGRVSAGTPLLRIGVRDSWTEATLEGWVWTASLQTTDREGLDLVVSAAQGENLRAEPSGTILARLEEGTLLEEVERRPGWTRVRRSGWIWTPSVSQATASQEEPRSGRDGAASGGGAATFLRAREGSAILSAPDGDTLATASGGDLQVLAREGSWVRVRMDGWVWSPQASEGGDEPEGSTDLEALTPEDLEGPGGEAHEGRRVTWTIQFISLERAEAVRTDFYEGEPFILGRVGGGDGPFVYVAVPPDRLPSVQGLTPLELVRVTGRVRRSTSALTGSPILDLLALERGVPR